MSLPAKERHEEDRPQSRWDALSALGEREKVKKAEELSLRHVRARIEQCRPYFLQDSSAVETNALVPLSTVQYSDVLELIDCVSEQYDRLPVDEIVRDVVLDIFCIILGTNTEDALKSRVLQVLAKLFQSPKYATALFFSSPPEEVRSQNVDAVVPHSGETTTRTKVLQCLQDRLPESADCLILALQVILSSGSHPGQRRCVLDMDVVRLQEYWMPQFDALAAQDADREKGMAAVQLLRCVLQYVPPLCGSHTFVQTMLFPKYCSSYASFTHGAPTTTAICSICQWKSSTSATASFLHILHSPASPVVQGSVIDCATQFMKHIPWSLWLGHSTHIGKRGSRSSFQNHLCDLIRDLIHIASCRIHQWFSRGDSKNDSTEAIKSFVHAIFMSIPYNNSNDRSLDYGYESVAVDLVDQIMQIPSAPFSFTLIECLRGYTTPSGVLSHTSVPVERWILNRGKSWVHAWLVSFLRDSSTFQTALFSTRLNLLYSLLSAYPAIILYQDAVHESICVDEAFSDNDTWQLYQRFVMGFVSNDPVIAARCIEKLLSGRQMYLKDRMDLRQEELLQFCIPILMNWIFLDSSFDDTIVTLASSCFACLFPSDWNTLYERTVSIDIQRLVNQMIAFCTSNSHSASFRSTNCKAIGGRDFCVQTFSSMKQLLMNDSSSSVQCMAMFVIGNLSHSLFSLLHSKPLMNEPELFGLKQDLQLIYDLAELCLVSISKNNAKNEKLATNAVRTTGYVSVLLVGLQKCSGSTVAEISEDAICQLIQRILQTYTQNIRTAIEVGTSDQNCWSWKQRSGIKKQGWGSCNALAVLFENNLWIDSDTASNEISESSLFYEEATSCLVECLENVNSVHEKMILSACNALRSIPDLTLVDNDVFGRAMVACCILLFDKEYIESIVSHQQKMKLHAEVDMLLFRLVSIVSLPSLQLALKVPAFRTYLGNLFQWMIERNGLPKDTFQCFAVAISTASCIAIEVEEQYRCQALSYNTQTHLDMLEEL